MGFRFLILCSATLMLSACSPFEVNKETNQSQASFPTPDADVMKNNVKFEILSPYTGETYNPGEDIIVSWSSSDSGALYNIDYEVSGTGETVPLQRQTASGEFVFTIPTHAEGQAITISFYGRRGVKEFVRFFVASQDTVPDDPVDTVPDDPVDTVPDDPVDTVPDDPVDTETDPTEPFVSYRGLYDYTTWGYSENGPYSGKFHTWETEGVVIYSINELTEQEIQVGAAYLNSCLNLYRTVGQKPNFPELDDPNGFGHKATVAIVPEGSTCGAGCGAGGRAEFTVTTAYDLWEGLSDVYGWAIGCYEMGRGGAKFPIYKAFDIEEHTVASAIPGLVYNQAFMLHGLDDYSVYQRKNQEMSPYNFREKFKNLNLSFTQSVDRSQLPKGSLPAASQQVIRWESDINANQWFVYFSDETGWYGVGSAEGTARSIEVTVPNKPGTEFTIMLGNFSFDSGEWVVARLEVFQIVDANQSPQYADSLNSFLIEKISIGEILQGLFFYMTQALGQDYMEKFFAETTAYSGPPTTGREISCNIMRAVSQLDRRSEAENFLLNEWNLPNDCQ